MMKTYTFAASDAPAREHMTGLMEGLRMWHGDCERQLSQAKTQKDQSYWRGRRDAFRQIIATIEDSNSI